MSGLASLWWQVKDHAYNFCFPGNFCKPCWDSTTKLRSEARAAVFGCTKNVEGLAHVSFLTCVTSKGRKVVERT